MIIFYTLLDAVEYLKWQIEREEERLKRTRDPSKRRWIEGAIEWQFERAIELIRIAKPGEVKEEALDFFLGRIKGERPDFVRLCEKLREKNNKTLPSSQTASQAIRLCASDQQDIDRESASKAKGNHKAIGPKKYEE